MKDIQKIISSFSSNTDDEVSYVFIDNFCDGEKYEEMLEIMGANFAIQAFTFTEGDSEVYLHCEVKIVTLRNYFSKKNLYLLQIF